MKAIVEYTEEEHLAMCKKLANLQHATSSYKRDELLEYSKVSGYAHYKFVGSYTDTLVAALGRHPDEDEIIMLVDCGYTHFGASCTINHRTKTFSGRVNID